jgi:hypothetical protein
MAIELLQKHLILDHPWENLAKPGYKLTMKAEVFKHPSIFFWLPYLNHV